jgi:HD-GYP domain-containing protein (c-di-GMP phosphodiesterase class II)
MTLMGVCAAELLSGSPLLLPTLAVPAVLIHRAVQQSTELRENVREALASLVDVVELRDPYTAGHSRRVAELARAIAIQLGLTAEEADAIEDAGNVHDLGKVAIDPAILLKPGKLTEAEWAEMKRHPVYGAEVLARFTSYRSGIPLVRSHHESWDGSGYPDGLRGTDIPLGARILAAADTFDALTSDRPYRAGMDLDRARAILQDGKGSQWDPAIIEALFLVLDAHVPKVDELSTGTAASDSAPADARAA